MLIDDEYIKKEVSIYQMTRSTISLNKIIDTLSGYIYYYPRKVYLVDYDKAIDFYVYYIERIDKIILKYRKMDDVKFITWFTHTLRNHYLNYVDMLKRKNKFSKEELTYDENALILYDVVSYEDKDSQSEKFRDISNLILENIKTKYKERDVFVFTIRYIELFINNIIGIITVYLNVDYADACNIIENARATYIKKYSYIIKYQDRITNVNKKISDNIKLSKPCEKLRNKKRYYVKRLSSINLLVPYLFIANLINLNQNIITKIINKVKNELKQMDIKF